MAATSATFRRLVIGLLAVFLLGVLAACAGDDIIEPPTPDEIRGRLQAVLDVRDKAVLEKDRHLFMSTVARGDRAFVRRQRAWFDNVSQLPWEVFRTRAALSSWPQMLVDPDWGVDASLPRLRQTTQLRDYDDGPVSRITGLAFGYRQGVLKVVGDRSRDGSPFPGWSPAPWDLTPITVRERSGALGLFDRTTLRDADEVMRAVVDGVGEVSRGLPFSWDGRVVAYAFGDKRVLNSFDNVPGGKIQHLGALTFPVRSGDESDQVVGLRFTVLPSSIEAGQPFLGRIVRHELTHVALGERDDAAPLWLSEGLAEYVGAREVPSVQRRIAASAVDRAHTTGASRMPSTATFNGPEQDWHYALSWMACDYVAERFGEARLWDLVDAFARGGQGSPDERQDQVLRSVLGMSSGELARHASDRIEQIYR